MTKDKGLEGEGLVPVSMASRRRGRESPVTGRGEGPAAAADPGATALPGGDGVRGRQWWRRRGSGVEEEQLTVALTPIPPFCLMLETALVRSLRRLNPGVSGPPDQEITKFQRTCVCVARRACF